MGYPFVKITKLFLGLVLVCLAGTTLYASERPKIGLVLSGGGARGAAHVGVIKVLEELRIPVDIVTGTSMGSIVGGLYASGMSAADIESVLSAMDWDKALSDNQSRQHISVTRKRHQDLFTTKLHAGLNKGKIELPSGAIQGQNIDLALQRLTRHVAQITDFDDLVIPFRAVASDIAKGDPVVLAGGSLAAAMRASMSVPSVFAPVRIDGRLLVDGGVTNNLPVNVARKMGAEILIVVDVSTPLKDEAELVSLFDITEQLTRLLTGQNTRASRESLSGDDILIIPDLHDITSSQFNRSEEAIPMGEKEARAHATRLSRLSLSPPAYQNYLANLNTIEAPDNTVLKVTLDNRSNIGNEPIRQHIELHAQDELDLDEIDKDIGQVYGMGFFEKVGYKLHYQPSGVDVDIYTIPKSWGPNYLHFGFDMDGGFKGENNTNIAFGYTRSALNKLGAEWTSLLQIGADPGFLTFFHQPFGKNLDYFIEPNFSTGRVNFGAFNEDGKEIADVRLKISELILSVGKEFGSRAAVVIGMSRTWGDTEVLIGNPLTPDINFDDGGVFLNFQYDTLDTISFPTSGSRVSASIYRAVDGLGAEETYSQWRLDMLKSHSFGKNTVVINLNAGATVSGQAAIPMRLSLGGFFQLSGLRAHQISGQYLGMLSAAYYRRVGHIKLLPAYLGVTAEYGGVWQMRSEISTNSAILAGSVFVGLDSPAGPLLLGIGVTDEGDTNFFARIGRIFN